MEKASGGSFARTSRKTAEDDWDKHIRRLSPVLVNQILFLDSMLDGAGFPFL
jgi:hypothetical protein